jgi:hypothetical protein
LHHTPTPVSIDSAFWESLADVGHVVKLPKGANGFVMIATWALRKFAMRARHFEL